MSKGQINLDLDDAGTFVSALHHLLDQSGIWSRLKTKNSAEILAELAHASDYVSIPFVRDLRAKTCNLVRSEYVTVSAYHACRPANYNHYTKYGVLRTNRQLLLRQAKEAFGQMPKLEEIFNPICSKYLKWYNGTVGLFLTAHKQTSWHKTSCFLGKMEDALGNEGKLRFQNYLSRSTPTMIQCCLPVDWLDSKMRDPSLEHYASAVLQKIVHFKTSPTNTSFDFGALGLKSDIPSEMIVDFIAME